MKLLETIKMFNEYRRLKKFVEAHKDDIKLDESVALIKKIVGNIGEMLNNVKQTIETTKNLVKQYKENK